MEGEREKESSTEVVLFPDGTLGRKEKQFREGGISNNNSRRLRISRG